MLLLSTKVPECNVEAIEWNWSGILLTPDLADTKEWPDPLGTRLEDEDFDTVIMVSDLGSGVSVWTSDMF